MTSSTSRSLYVVVHIAGLEQNVHWNGHPRETISGMSRSEWTPYDLPAAQYFSRYPSGQYGHGIVFTSLTRGRFPFSTNVPERSRKARPLTRVKSWCSLQLSSNS